MTDGLNNKNQELINLVTTTNEKLDQVITLLGGIPTSVKTTDDLYEVLSDIHTDTQSIDAKLLAIRNYIKDPSEDDIPGDFKSLLWNIYLLRSGSVIEDNSSGIWPLQAMLSYIGELLSTELSAIKSYNLDTRNYLFNGLRNLGVGVIESSDTYDGYLAISRDLIALIQGAIGVPVDGLTYPDQGQRDIIQLLEKAASRPESNIGSGLTPPDVCSDAYVSNGMFLIPSLFEAWPSTVWATFPEPPPAGISFGEDFGLGVEASQLVISGGSWAGWSIYVASSANNFGIFVGPNYLLSAQRYPTNVWLSFAFLHTNLSVFVGGSDSLRVWLCGNEWGPGGGGGGPWGGGGGGGGSWGDCVDVNSASAVITHPNNATTSITYIPMSSIPGYSFGSVLPVSGGGEYTASVNDWTAEENGNGVTVELLSGDLNAVRLLWQHADLSFGTHIFAALNESFTIPDDCIRWDCDTFSGGAVGPFSVRVCPTGVTP
jgi:hypothetical protein